MQELYPFFQWIVYLWSSPTFHIFGQALLLFLFSFWVSLILWIARDIVSRSESLVYQIFAILLGVFFLPGWVLYLMLRPPRTLAERYDEELERKAFLESIHAGHHACPSCETIVDAHAIYCPVCQYQLKLPCHACKTPLDRGTHYCTHCGAEQKDFVFDAPSFEQALAQSQEVITEAHKKEGNDIESKESKKDSEK